MLETILCVVGVTVLFVSSTYLVSTKDRRMDYVEREKLKREHDLLKWL